MAKVDIFSGFLGAGKTTLIKKLIKEAYQGEQVVLIENEFGEIGVDTGFLRDSGVQINEMVAGCICCTLVGDFGRALNEVIEKYSPDRILIEPSGVGKLSDVIIAVQDQHNEKIELNAFTTVVDAKRYKTYMRNFGEFYKNQVEHASSIFLSHQQELSAEQLDECLQFLREMNPNATIVTTDWDELSGEKMLDVMEQKKTLNSELDKLREEAHEELEHHHHEHEEHEHHHHDHEHHHHHHDHDEDHECCCGHDHEHHHHHDHEEHEHHHHHEEDHECCCGYDHEHEHHHHEHDDEHECCCGHDHEHEHHHHDHEHHHHHDHEEHEHHHDHHDHDEEHECSCGCGHHHGHDADEVFEEFGTTTAIKYTQEELETAIDEIEECGEVLRAKGIVECTNGKWLEFDYVPGEGEIRETEAEASGMIVVIGTHIKEDKIKKLFKLQ